MAQVYSWRNSPDVRVFLLKAVEALGEGRLVVLPTDTDYCVCADPRRPEAVAALDALALPNREIGVAYPEQALSLVPTMTPSAQRLTRRCWRDRKSVV